MFFAFLLFTAKKQICLLVFWENLQRTNLLTVLSDLYTNVKVYSRGELGIWRIGSAESTVKFRSIFGLDKSKPNMSRNLYMNLYVQQIFNQEPCKKWFGDTTHNICFSNALQERKTWNFFLSDYILVDVRHFVGFLFRPYGKKQFSRQFTFLEVVLESLQSTELATWHISWTFPPSIWCLVTWQAQCLARILVCVFFWGFFCV